MLLRVYFYDGLLISCRENRVRVYGLLSEAILLAERLLNFIIHHAIFPAATDVTMLRHRLILYIVRFISIA